MPRTDLYVNLSITGELAPFRIVAHDGSGGYKQAKAATEAFVGTADELGKQPNGGADVAMNYQPEVEAGGAIAAGDPLTSDAQGRAVKATAAGNRIIGFACKAATDAGEIIDYQFAPGFLATAGAYSGESIMATTTPFASNPQLSAIALAYMNQPSDYVADHVMPRVKAIGKKEFQYSIYGLESFAAPDSRVGRKGRPNEVSLSSSLATAAIEDYGLEDPIPQDDIDQGRKDGRDIAGESTEYLLSLVKLDRELRVARLVQDKNNYAAACVKELGSGAGIDVATVDAEAVIAEMLEKPFMRPNIGVMSQKVWDRLSRNPLLIKAIKGELVGKKLTTAEFCSYFELEQLYIGKARVTRQVKGKTPVPERVWGTGMAFHYRDMTASEQRGVTWGLTVPYGQPFAGSRTDPDIGLRGGIRIRAGESLKELVLAKDAGCLITGAIAAS